MARRGMVQHDASAIDAVSVPHELQKHEWAPAGWLLAQTSGSPHRQSRSDNPRHSLAKLPEDQRSRTVEPSNVQSFLFECVGGGGGRGAVGTLAKALIERSIDTEGRSYWWWVAGSRT